MLAVGLMLLGATELMVPHVPPPPASLSGPNHPQLHTRWWSLSVHLSCLSWQASKHTFRVQALPACDHLASWCTGVLAEFVTTQA